MKYILFLFLIAFSTAYASEVKDACIIGKMITTDRTKCDSKEPLLSRKVSSAESDGKPMSLEKSYYYKIRNSAKTTKKTLTE